MDDQRSLRAHQLTPREAEVSVLVADGLTNQQIGRRLGLSPRTVEYHLGRARGKLDLPNRAAVAAHIQRHRSVPTPPTPPVPPPPPVSPPPVSPPVPEPSNTELDAELDAELTTELLRVDPPVPPPPLAREIDDLPLRPMMSAPSRRPVVRTSSLVWSTTLRPPRHRRRRRGRLITLVVAAFVLTAGGATYVLGGLTRTEGDASPVSPPTSGATVSPTPTLMDLGSADPIPTSRVRGSRPPRHVTPTNAHPKGLPESATDRQTRRSVQAL